MTVWSNSLSWLHNRIHESLPPILRERVEMIRRLGYIPRIRYPRTFNEKLAHRKHCQYDSRYIPLSDKWEVRAYVRERVGEQYLSEAYGVYRSVEEIDFDRLPERFVVKPTHTSGHTFFVPGKSSQIQAELAAVITDWLRISYGAVKGEYWYSKITPRVIIEEWLHDKKQKIPLDFKFHVFHGRVELLQVDFDRQTFHTRNFYDRNWQEIPVSFKFPRKPNANLQRPATLNKMIAVAEDLGAEFDYVRVDLYSLDETRVVFGELTFAPESGRGRFQPKFYDIKLGEYWNIHAQNKPIIAREGSPPL